MLINIKLIRAEIKHNNLIIKTATRPHDRDNARRHNKLLKDSLKELNAKYYGDKI